MCFSAFNNWTEQHESTCSITIKDLGNVRNACDKLLKSHIERRGDDYDLAYSDRIKEALKKKPTKEEEMNVGYLVEI